MEIRRIQYTNVYGSLSGDLKFSRGENFLVGINGCGKTTVLNLIRWVLGPSIPELCTLEHDMIKIDIKHGEYLYSIQSRIKKGKHELSVESKDPSHNFKTIRTSLTTDPRLINTKVQMAQARSRYRGLSPEPDEIDTWSFLLNELPSPVFIGLERTIDENSSDQRMGKSTRDINRLEVTSAPITARNLMRDAFNSSRRRLVEINDDLNKKVIELSFSAVLRRAIEPQKTSILEKAKKIEQLKTRFEKSANEGAYSKTLSSNEVRNAVVTYLNDLASLLRVDSKSDHIWLMLNQQNFERASKMFDLFEDHEKKAQNVQREINNFIKAVNLFLNDSGKSIHFDEDTGSPFFENVSSSDKLKLTELSSGESQIVVILSYFAFYAKTGIPIIIDEPELSLHVKWQQQFVSAVKNVMPVECQTIMATHSPEICGAQDVNVQSISVRKSQ